ncbi:hypothetical protein GCM10009549_08540 [Streptomyces thermoalcalitolerans]|uniref:Uncharacterized protein n=1 Tax=Streptomyces thermoalcalitolerans TaxID=65605 RepID=A0ABN1NEV9_9ACTN
MTFLPWTAALQVPAGPIPRTLLTKAETDGAAEVSAAVRFGCRSQYVAREARVPKTTPVRVWLTWPSQLSP